MATTVAIAAVVVALDQVTKSWATTALAHHSHSFVGPISFRLRFNSGAAFSLFTGSAPLLAVVALALSGVLCVVGARAERALTRVGCGLVMGGALGNLCDRLFRSHHGGVVDFIYTSFWPTFNVADSCVVIGAFVIALSLWHTRPAGATEVIHGH